MTQKNNIKVLVIEDTQELQEIYTTKLEQMGYDYISATDGVDGLNKAIDLLPDLILLDIMIPKKDGFTVLEELKQNIKTKNIPVIILSNLGQGADVQKGKDLGADDYFVKAESTPAQLMENIKNVLEKYKK
jgi:DNA-binding response OmpR family regulator